VAELLRRTFRVTLEVTISVNEIDEALIKSHEKFFHDPALANDPSTLEYIARDRRLLAAVLQTPHVLERVLTQRVADSLESICPEDKTLDALQTIDRTEEQLIDDVRELLPAEDYEYHRGSCEVGVFYDNSTYFQDAFTTQQHDFAVQELLNE
jgi:hypothetical protein